MDSRIDNDPLGILTPNKSVPATTDNSGGDDPLGILKKKVNGNVVNNGSQTASPIASQSQNGFENQSPIDLAKQASDLSTKTQVVNNPAMTGGMSMGTSSSSTIPDANAVAQSQKINDYLKSQKIDPDQVNKVFGDMPQQAYDMTLPDGTKPQSKQELFSEWQANPIDAENKINNIKTQFALQNAGTQQSLAQNPNDSHAAQQRGIELGNAFMQLQGSPSQSMDDYYNKIQKQQQLIGANLSGDERDKALARLQATTAPNINTNQPELLDEYNQSPLKNIVDPNEYAGLQTLKLFDPQKYQQAVDILQTQITPQYDLPNAPNSGGGGMLTAPTITTDKSLGGTLSQLTIDKQIAQENTHRQLLSIGRENDITNLTSQQYNLNKQYEQTQDPAQKQQIQSQYQQVQDQINGIKQQALSDDKNFPLTAGLKFDNEVKDITGQAGVGLMTYGTDRFVKGFQNTTNTVEDILTGLFGNKQDNTNLAMKRIGETQTYQSQMYLPANLNSENVPYTLQASKSLKDQANKILNGRSLSELSPAEQGQLKDLVANNPSQITTVNNDGKHNNFFSKATAYTMAGFTGDIASFIAQTYGLGALGLGGRAAEATTLFNTTYSDAYNNAISEGDSSSIANQKGLVNGGIMALAGLVSSKYDAIKNILGNAKSPISKQIAGMGEDAWNSVVNDNKSLINKIAKSAKDVVGENAKMIATYGVGTSIATDLANKAIFNKNISTDDIINNAVEGAKQMTLGSIALMGAGFLTHIMKSPLTMADKVNMWNLASEPDISTARINDALQNNQITSKQASDRIAAINRLSGLMDNIPDVNNKLKPLTDEQKVRYLYNEFVKSKANESLLTLPESQQNLSSEAISNSDLENQKILQGNESVDTKLSQPIEGLDDQGIPIGDNVPAPQNIKNETTKETEVPKPTEASSTPNEEVDNAGEKTAGENVEESKVESTPPTESKPSIKNKWEIGDKIPKDYPRPSGVVKSIVKEGDTHTTVEMDNGWKVDLPKNKNSYLEDMGVSTPTSKPKESKETLSSILEKHENADNSTFNDLVNNVEGFNENEQNPEITKAIDKYRDEQAYDQKLKGRGDMESAEKDFQNVLDQEIKKEKSKPSITSNEVKDVKAKEKYEINWKDPEDWEQNEDTNRYEVGSTKNFDIEVDPDREGIIFNFKDENRQKKQVEELDTPIVVNLERDRSNRVHINGISESNLNKGFGKEIYHALLDNNSIISTSSASASEDAQRVWNSLIKSGEYYWAKLGSLTAVSKSKEPIDRFIEKSKPLFGGEKPDIERGEPTKNEQIKELSKSNINETKPTAVTKEDIQPETENQNQNSESVETPPIPPEPPKTENENLEPESGDNKVGVSHKSLTDIAKKLGLKEPERGSYPKLSEIADRGRQLLEAGADPNEVTNPKQDLDERISIGRAHLEDLKSKMDEIARDEKLGIKSDEYAKAVKDFDNYAEKVKTLGTDAGRAMYSLQGERDLDTGSFSAVRQAYKKSNGEPSVEDTNKILDLTKRVKNLEDENDAINKKLIELTDKEVGKNEPKSEGGKFENKAKNLADKFRKLKTKEFKFTDSNGKEYDLQKMGVSWNDVVELGAKAIEVSGRVADGVATVIDKIKDSAFYKDIVDKEGFEKLLQSRYQDMIDATPEGKELKRLKARVEKLESGNIDKKEKTKLNFTKEQQDEYNELKSKIKDLNDAFGLNEKPKGVSSLYEKNKEVDQIGNLLEMFADKRPNDMKFTPEEAKALWDYAKKTYLEKGVSYKDMISMVGKDLGLSFDQVYEAINTTKTRPISNEMWNKNAELNREKRKVKDFVEKKNTNVIGKILEYPSKIVTGTAVYGHGGIFTGTHAGMTYTDLPRAKYTMKAFVNGYKLAYSKGDAYNERMMQQLKDRPNYVIAQRAGLQNIPGEVSNDEYARMQKFFKKVGGDAGVKGFNAIKILRQDLFDSHFRDLSPAEQQDMGALQSIAELVNNATGATNLNIKIRNKAGEVVVDPGKVLFAAEMESARWEKLLANPIKAANTGMRIIGDMVSGKKTVSAGDKVFARVWAKRVGWELATYAGLLYSNSLFQKWLNPKNPVNLDDPSGSGFLRMKVGDNTIDMSSGMLGSIGLIANLATTALENQKKLGGDSRLKKEAATLGYYGRGKLNPFYGTLGELALFKTDFAGNPLPFSKDKPKAGKHTLTWAEYAWEKAPIPIADAAKDIYDNMKDNGMSKPQIEKFWSWATLGHFGAALGEAGITGFHISDSHNRPTPFTDEDNKIPAFKYFLDKGMELPNTSPTSEKIKDYSTSTYKKLSDYPADVQQQYSDLHKQLLQKSLEKVERRNFVYISNFGNVSFTYPESSTDRYKRKSLDDMSKDELAKVLRAAQSEATEQTKQQMFYKKKK